MSEDYLAQQLPTLSWNTARGVWEKVGMANLLCEHWELFSATWQTSGMMRNGQVFELPTQAHLTTDSESLSSLTLRTPMASDSQGGHKSSVPGKAWSLVGQVRNEFTDKELLRTPTASQGEGGALGEEEARKRGNTVGIRDQAMDLAKLNGEQVSRNELNLMPTPNTMDHLPARTAEQKAANKGKGGYANVRETVINDLIPTPTTRDYKDGSEPHERDGVVQTDTVARAVFNSGEILPTPTASDWKGANHSGSGSASSRGMATVVEQTNWGKFEPAIRRWEEVLGRPAPAPTKPDGKDGAHRLSSAFTEWMMGVPKGWITDVGLSRNDELKACGNGVVWQQAALALKVLLDGVLIELEAGQELSTLDPQTDKTGVGRVNSATQDRQKQ